MTKLFAAEFYAQNRNRLHGKLAGMAPIILTANGQLQRSGDTTFQFQQDSNFWYLTGLDLPDLILVITVSDEYIVVPSRSASREAFDGSIDFAELTRISGISTIYEYESGWERLHKDIAAAKSVATAVAAPAYIEGHGMYTNPARARLMDMLQVRHGNLSVTDIRPDLTSLRMVKQPEELAALQQAIDITCSGIGHVTDPTRFATYKHEYEIEADLTREFRFGGSNGHAFAPIVASGQQGCTLHNVSNSADIDTDSLVIMDVGAEIRHYAADITRTRIHGTATPRQQAIFDAVLEVQHYGLNLLKPGVFLKEYEQKIEVYMGSTLQSLGLITNATDHDAIRKYYPHATSHFLGLDVHDVGDYARPLEPGMVLTCEPGIYIPEESIGVRIEDDLVITDAGNYVMSQQLPKTLM